ncbi:hypothetical protein Ocin01_13204 [Orchesella cincta]|uniref:Uncharacterized protein n=1 Tax=Orchesella cincta TaxID=48709 RepID=A0A1D2MKD1_ORCCI|nr:hypothetical protein Ocin01_13204 [Orchesella cincta]
MAQLSDNKNYEQYIVGDESKSK